MENFRYVKKCILIISCVILYLFSGCGASETGNGSKPIQSIQEITTSYSDNTPYTIPHEITTVNVNVDEITDLLPLNHTMRNYIYLESKKIDKSNPREDYYENLDVVADKQVLDLPIKGSIYSITSLQNKLIFEASHDSNNGVVSLGIFDPYTKAYEIIDEIPFSAGYGKYSLTMYNRYYVTVVSENTENGLTGYVIIYDIEMNTLKIIDEFEEYNIVNGITAVGDNALAYFYYETETQDWIVKYYNFDTAEIKEIFRHSNNNANTTSSLMAIGSDGDEIVLVIQYISNGVYSTNLEWITASGDWHKTENIDLDELYGNKYEITGIKICNEYYFIDAFIIGDEINTSSILKRTDNCLNIYAFNTLTAIAPLSEDFSDISDIRYINTRNDNNSIDGIFMVDLIEESMRSYDFSEDLTLEDRVFVNSFNDLIILYFENSSIISYQIIPNFTTIDVKPMDGDIPVFPGEIDPTMDVYEKQIENFREKAYYYN